MRRIQSRRVANLGIDIAELGVRANHTVSGLEGDSAQLKICIPEVQQQTSGLSVNSNSGSILLNNRATDSFLTSAFLQNPTVISSNCTKLLEPNSTTNG